MESRAYALITGLFVLGIAACIAVWAQWLNKTPVARTAYRVVAAVPVTGLNPEAEVRYRGMRVGRVTAMGLDAKDPRRILVDIEIDSDIPITKGTYARLGMEGITGLAYVHLLDDYNDMALAGKAASGYRRVAAQARVLRRPCRRRRGRDQGCARGDGEPERPDAAGKPQAHLRHAGVAGAHHERTSR